MIKRGSCPFGTKSENAGRMGALAAIIYNNEPGLFGGTLGEPKSDHVPTIGISDTDAVEYIEELLKGVAVEASFYIGMVTTT